MKTKLTYLLIFIIFTFLNACSPQISEKLHKEITTADSDIVMVKPDKVIFIFKLEQKKSWAWHQKKNSTPRPEYQWLAEFNFNNKGYIVSYTLHNLPFQHNPGRGSLEDLIEVGNVNLYVMDVKPAQKIDENHFKVTSEVQSHKNLDSQVILTSDTFAVIVNKKSIANGFVKNRPDSLIYSYLFPGKKPLRKKVEINYIQM